MKEVYEVTEKDGTWRALFVISRALKEDQASDETASVKFLHLPWTSQWKRTRRGQVYDRGWLLWKAPREKQGWDAILKPKVLQICNVSVNESPQGQ